MDLLLEGDELDHVVEQVWMMLNYVSTYCAGTSQYRDNLWAEFVTFFRRNFLLPLMQQWYSIINFNLVYLSIFFTLLKFNLGRFLGWLPVLGKFTTSTCSME